MPNPNIIKLQEKNRKLKGATLFDVYPQFEKQNRDIVVPFLIYGGAVNNTPYGESKKRLNPSDYQQFNRLFTGQENVLAIWEGSTKALKKEETDTFLTKEIQAGKFYELFKTNDTTTTEFVPASKDVEVTAQQTAETVTFISENWRPVSEDYFKLYLIPTRGDNKLYYLHTAYVITDPNNPSSFVYAEITFAALNNLLANTGAAIEQFVQYSAPGEGYAYPKVTYNTSTKKLDVILDQDRLTNIPITAFQTEIYGSGAITGLTLYGRRIKTGDENITAPKLLFAYKFEVPIPSATDKTSGGENNFYFIEEGKVNINAYYSSWKDKAEERYDFGSKKKYEGGIEINKTEVLATNPDTLISGETRKLDIFDDTWKIKGHGSTYNTSGIPYMEDEITFKLNEEYTAPQILLLSSLIHLDTNKLPIQATETVVWSLKEIPIIGGFLNLATFGLPIGWRNSNVTLKAKPVTFFATVTTIDFAVSGLDTQSDILPIEIFRNDTDDTVGAMYGTNNITTSMKIVLTDKIRQNILDEAGNPTEITEDFDTVLLGQDLEKGGKRLNATATPLTPTLQSNEGFVIDLINQRGIYKSNMKFSAYSGSTPLFQVTLQSKSKYSDSMREWNDVYKLSQWEEDAGKVIDFPEAVIPKEPPISSDTPEFSVVPKVQTIYNEYCIPVQETTTFAQQLVNSTVEDEFDIDLNDYLENGYADLVFYNTIQLNVDNATTKQTGIFDDVADNIIQNIDPAVFDDEGTEIDLWSRSTTGIGDINTSTTSLSPSGACLRNTGFGGTLDGTRLHTHKITGTRTGDIIKFKRYIILEGAATYDNGKQQIDLLGCEVNYITNRDTNSQTLSEIKFIPNV